MATAALGKGKCTGETLDMLSEHSYGDARRALALFRHSVQRAEEANAKKLTPNYVVWSNYEHYRIETEEMEDILSSHESILYEAIKKLAPVTASRIEKFYINECDKRRMERQSSRTVRKYLTRLCQIKIIKKERGAGTSGWIYRTI
jgi:Cdc6-like AAA superfamily ATPase